MTHRRLLAITLAVLFLSNGLTGCSGCNPSNKRIECIDPVTGATITMADDLNATTPGIQIAVTCTVRGFDIGDPITLNVRDDIAGTDRDYNLPYDGTGTIEFSPVSVAGGTVDTPNEYTLFAYADDGDVESNAVSINVVAEVVTCPEFDFIDPADGDEWNQSDDSRGDLSDGFQHDVVITTDAGDAESVALYLNDALVDTGTVDGTRIEFSDVTFPSGGGSMTLRIQTTEACFAEAEVTIDDGSPACNITAPMPTDPSGWINATFDTSTSAGMQADITIETENGATVELYVDIPLTDTPTLTGTADGSGALTFSAVELAEAAFGELTLQARCRDAAGNPGVSSLNSYGVDSILPTIAVTDPTGGEHYNDDDDVNTSMAGIQINVSIHTDQPSSSARVHPCGGSHLEPEGLVDTDTSGDGTGQVHLGGTDGDVDICGTISKVSGNTTTSAPVTVTVDTAAPGVVIVDPTDGATILIVDDEGTTDTICQYTVLVDCEAIGQDVLLYDTTAGLIGTQSCVADTGSSLGGRATFTAQVLEQGARVLYAEHSDSAGNTGRSTDVDVEVDTEPPVVSVLIPSCGATISLAPPYETDVYVTSSDFPLTLTVRDSTGTIIGSPYVETTGTGGTAHYVDVTLALGTVTLEACATDDHGQPGCNAACSLTVQNLPNVVITYPADRAVLGLDDDENSTTSGLQTHVTFTADVPSGSATRLVVGGTAITPTLTYSPGGTTYSNVSIAEGTAISIMACATDTRGEGCRTISVDVDITPPPSAITDLAITVDDRRAGEITLTWTAPADTGGGAVADYDVRCSTSDITNDTEFGAATQYTYSGSPSSPGAGDSISITGLFVGLDTTYYCAVKSLDGADNPSAMSNVPSQDVQYIEVQMDPPTSGLGSAYGWSLSAVGDVNNDGYEDYLVGTWGNDRAYLFLGGDPPDFTTPATTFSGPSGSYFGRSVTGLGNFDGDSTGYNDIAIGAYLYGSGKGAAYVFTGRPTWPSTLSFSSAELKIQCDDPSTTADDGAWFGVRTAAAGDFDGDTRPDLLVGASRWDGRRGAAFIIRGRTSLVGATISVPGTGSGLIGDFYLPGGYSAVGDFGYAVSGIGDTNSDARSEIIVGAPQQANGGSVYLYRGRSSSGSGLISINTSGAYKTFNAPSTGIQYGNGVSGIGDYNGDGQLDIAIAAPTYGSGAGRIYVYLRNPSTGFSTTTPSFIIDNPSTSPGGDLLGIRLPQSQGLADFATVGTINNDARDDFLYGMDNYGTAGGDAWIEFGLTSPSDHTCEAADIAVRNPGNGSSTQPFHLGDINDDGFSDFAVEYGEASGWDGVFFIYY